MGKIIRIPVLALALILTLTAANCQADDGYDESQIDSNILQILAVIEGSSLCRSVKEAGLMKIARCIGCDVSKSSDLDETAITINCHEDLVMSRTRFLRFTGLIGSDWSLDSAAMKRASIIKRTAVALGDQFAHEAFKDKSTLHVSVRGQALLIDEGFKGRPIDIFAVRLDRSQADGGRFSDLLKYNPEYLSLVEIED